MKTLVVFIILFGLKLVFSLTVKDYKNIENQEYWRHKGRDEIFKEISVKKNVNKAKNVILFIGDGMGMPTITASRVFKEQTKGIPYLSFERFPHIALSQVSPF